MIKGSIQEEDITNVNIYAPNIGAPHYIRQMLTTIKGGINSNTIIVGDFNTLLSPMDRSSKLIINKRASLVAQWLRVCLPMQGTRVRALVWEDPTCHGATGPVSHNY